MSVFLFKYMMYFLTVLRKIIKVKYNLQFIHLTAHFNFEWTLNALHSSFSVLLAQLIFQHQLFGWFNFALWGPLGNGLLPIARRLDCLQHRRHLVQAKIPWALTPKDTLVKGKTVAANAFLLCLHVANLHMRCPVIVATDYVYVIVWIIADGLSGMRRQVDETFAWEKVRIIEVGAWVKVLCQLIYSFDVFANWSQRFSGCKKKENKLVEYS